MRADVFGFAEVRKKGVCMLSAFANATSRHGLLATARTPRAYRTTTCQMVSLRTRRLKPKDYQGNYTSPTCRLAAPRHPEPADKITTMHLPCSRQLPPRRRKNVPGQRCGPLKSANQKKNCLARCDAATAQIGLPFGLIPPKRRDRAAVAEVQRQRGCKRRLFIGLCRATAHKNLQPGLVMLVLQQVNHVRALRNGRSPQKDGGQLVTGAHQAEVGTDGEGTTEELASKREVLACLCSNFFSCDSRPWMSFHVALALTFLCLPEKRRPIGARRRAPRVCRMLEASSRTPPRQQTQGS